MTTYTQPVVIAADAEIEPSNVQAYITEYYEVSMEPDMVQTVRDQMLQRAKELAAFQAQEAKLFEANLRQAWPAGLLQDVQARIEVDAMLRPSAIFTISGDEYRIAASETRWFMIAPGFGLMQEVRWYDTEEKFIDLVAFYQELAAAAAGEASV